MRAGGSGSLAARGSAAREYNPSRPARRSSSLSRASPTDSGRSPAEASRPARPARIDRRPGRRSPSAHGPRPGTLVPCSWLTSGPFTLAGDGRSDDDCGWSQPCFAVQPNRLPAGPCLMSGVLLHSIVRNEISRILRTTFFLRLRHLSGICHGTGVRLSPSGFSVDKIYRAATKVGVGHKGTAEYEA